MLDLTFNGHANFTITDGEHTILLDPWFTGNPKAVTHADDVERADLILVTHGHADHLGDAVELSKRLRCPIVAPFELAMFCQRRGAQVHAMNHGGSHLFDIATVRMVWAVHSSAFVDKGSEYTGNPCGFVIEMGGLTTYFTGDTALFSDMALIAELYPVDLMIAPIGDNFTMGPREAARAVGLVKPRWAVPMHYGTFEVLEQSSQLFVEHMKGLEADPVVLNVGDTRRFE